MTTHDGSPFEDRLLASLTEIDAQRPITAQAASPAPARGRSGRLARPVLLGAAAALVIAGGALAAGVIRTLLFEASPVPQVAGDQLAAKGTGCAPGATVTVALDGRAIGSVVAYETGDFAAPVPIPAGTTAGRHAVTASCPNPAGTTISQASTIEIVTERPPLGPVMNANLVSARPGSTVTLRVGPARAGTDVEMTLDGKRLPAVHADTDGWLDVPVTLPAGTTLGNHALRATGTVPDGRTFDQTTEVEVSAK